MSLNCSLPQLLHGGVDVGSSLGVGVLQLALLDAMVSTLPPAKIGLYQKKGKKVELKGFFPSGIIVKEFEAQITIDWKSRGQLGSKK